MIYYISGLNSREIKIEEIMKEFSDIKIYDANIKDDYDKFITDIDNTSLFSTRELIILKRAEKLKKMKDLINYLKTFTNDDKTIIIDYYAEYKNKNLYLNDFKKIKANVINIEDDMDLINDYMTKNLNISETNKKKLLELIGTDYNHIKNEIYKYNTVLGKDEFSFEKLEGLISVNETQKIYDISQKIIYEKINYESIPQNLYMGIIYNIYSEFLILHTLNKIGLSTDYNKFKEEYENYKDLFNNMHFYRVFLKNKLKYKYSNRACFKILLECNKNESMMKSGFIDDKNAFYNIYQTINKLKK